MTSQSNLQVVIGASGGIGSAVVRLLASPGKSVRAVYRSGRLDVPDGVEAVAADAMEATSTDKACEGAAVVYNCVHPTPGEEYSRFVTMSQKIVDGAEYAGAKLVLAASAYILTARSTCQ